MMRSEIPTDDEVVAALMKKPDARSTAIDLCDALVAAGHSRRDSQLAIQRATERRRVVVGSNWMLSLPEKVAAA